jgi:L-threonylcarbamoyladenylate synthase
MSAELSPELLQQIDKAVEILKAGGVVAFPTDTVYGLGASAFDSGAVERVYEVKQRPRHLPLPVLLAGEAQASIVASVISRSAAVLMKHFWPGGLTLILPKSASVPGNITGGTGQIAVRVPDHVIPITLISRLGVPVIGTSANVSTHPSVLTAEEVRAQLGSAVDLIIDGGRCPGGIESTVVDVTADVPVIVRRGAVSEAEIERVLNNFKEA